jgi:hypothetical protein
MNEQEAKAWRLKSQVWLEAEAIVREGPAGKPPGAPSGVLLDEPRAAMEQPQVG